PTSDDEVQPEAEDGWGFDEWYADSECTQMLDMDLPITGDMTIYAGWAELITITFDAQGHGQAPAPVRVSPGRWFETPALSADGWYFGGWYYWGGPDGTEKISTNLIFYEDTTIYADWYRMGDTCTVTFDTGGYGVQPAAITDFQRGMTLNDYARTVLGEPVSVFYPDDDLAAHLRFQYWMTDKNDPDSSIFFGGTHITEDTTLYAYWSVLSTKVNNLSASWDAALVGAPAVCPEVRSGDSRIEVTDARFTTNYPAGTVFEYEQTYPIQITVETAHDDYTFAPESELGTSAEIVSWSEHRVVYIVDMAVAPTVLITFDANGHGTAPAPIRLSQYSILEDYAYAHPDVDLVPEASGWTFTGWYWDAACTDPVDPIYDELFRRDTPFYEATFYAGWDEGGAYIDLETEIDVVIGQTFDLRTLEWTDAVVDDWSSSSPETVSVSSRGTVTVTKFGDAVISGYSPDKQHLVLITVHTLFNDVTDNSQFYYSYIYWGAEQGLTTGYADNTFRPTNACNRAQVVTFLWRLAGEPEPTRMATFRDMTGNATFDKAISWAVEQGITTGWSSDNTFRPWNTCNRASIMTFLWRYAGRPTPRTTATFKDMTDNTDFNTAISWAAENGITTGWSDNTFRPWNTCNRLQVMSFLYRYAHLD
ncbi:MAG: S-layer homology domain-containing protein, partial [Lachnospiraceae bacterium]|nr:S-layer homology domain-containing protein [Lachnospiraceae bacterium]